MPVPIIPETISSFSSQVGAASSATARSRHAPSGSKWTELLSLEDSYSYALEAYESTRGAAAADCADWPP